MPSLIEIVLHPDRGRPPPEPLAVSLVPVARTGIALWLVALVVVTILWATENAPAEAVWTCAAGALLGLAGLAWAHRHSPPEVVRSAPR